MVISSIFPGFPRGRDPSINYNWADVAGATGYVLYDFWARDPTFAEGAGAGFEGHLDQANDMDELTGSSNRGRLNNYLSANSTSNTSVQLVDLDFDTTVFQLPTAIKGTAIIRAQMTFTMVGAANTCYYYMRARIRKISGGETEIAAGTSRIYGDSVTYTDYTFQIPVVIPLTSFKKGDQLRVTIECWCRNSNGTSAFNMGTTFDPLDASGAAGNSRMVVAIPYRIPT